MTSLIARSTATASLALVLAAGHAGAASPGARDAISMVERAAALVKEKGTQEMMRRIVSRDPDFFGDEMYVDMRDMYTGIVLAHPLDPQMMGTANSAAVGAMAGQYPRQVIELAQKSGKGWVDHAFRHPASGVLEAKKTSYVLRVGDVVLEAGIVKK